MFRFTGIKGFINSYKHRDKVPMSSFWKWLLTKWKLDLCVIGNLIINPHITILFLIGIVCCLFSDILDWISETFNMRRVPAIRLKILCTTKHEDKMREIAGNFWDKLNQGVHHEL